MNGVDVAKLQVGDIMELSENRARMMVDQDWADYAPDIIVAHLLTSSRRSQTDLAN